MHNKVNYLYHKGYLNHLHYKIANQWQNLRHFVLKDISYITIYILKNRKVKVSLLHLHITRSYFERVF